jgi:peptide/nickel transport system permease protein
LSSESARLTREREKLRQQLGLDLPVFYFSVSSLSTPAVLPPMETAGEQEAYHRLIHQYGSWQSVHAYKASLQTWYLAHDNMPVLPDSVAQQWRFSAAAVLSLREAYDAADINAVFTSLNKIYTSNSDLLPLQKSLTDCRAAYEQMEKERQIWRNYIPVIRWHGQNQYHRWMFGDGHWLTGKGAVYAHGLIRGDLGTSYVTQLPVRNIIASRIGWSLFFTVTSVLLAYLISLPIGLRAAAKRHSLFDRSSSVVLFMLYSLPSFWVATLLLMNFANPDILKIFPASGIAPTEGFSDNMSRLARIGATIPYLVLPTICFTYSQLAFLSRITRVSTLEVFGQDFIRTARAKGLSENTVLYRHAFRNALLPIITVFSNIFPAAVGGSVILETVFTIPGMGREIVQAIYQQDYPVIVSVFTLTGILTLFGYLLADILYAAADPRIQWKK